MADRVSRRALLRGGVGAAAGAAVLGGPFRGFVALANGAPRQAPNWRDLRAIPDLRDGEVRLWLPEGFQYRSFHDTEFPVVLDDGTVLPGRHDGMAAFPGPNGNVMLVRNHEINNPVPAFGPGTPYDPMAGGGTTTVEVTLDGRGRRRVHQPQRHADELLRRRDAVGQLDHVRGDGQRARRRARLHRRVQRPADSSATASSSRCRRAASPTVQPITRAGRFAHEAAAFDPRHGHLYLTEDNFGFPSGLYRYSPPSNPMETGRLEDGGRLQMLAVEGMPNADLAATQPANARYRVDVGRHRRSRPDVPVHAGPDGADDQQHGAQLRRAAGLRPGRGPLLPPRGRGVRARRRVLLLDAGRWPAGAERRRHRPGLGQRLGPDLGVLAPAASRSASSTSRPVPRRSTSRTT